jgi:hypothetical protein
LEIGDKQTFQFEQFSDKLVYGHRFFLFPWFFEKPQNKGRSLRLSTVLIEFPCKQEQSEIVPVYMGDY